MLIYCEIFFHALDLNLCSLRALVARSHWLTVLLAAIWAIPLPFDASWLRLTPLAAALGIAARVLVLLPGAT